MKAKQEIMLRTEQPSYESLQKKIKELKIKMLALEKAEAALKASEERFRVISESLPVGVFEMDENGNCVYTNTRWQEIFNSQYKHYEGWDITNPQPVETEEIECHGRKYSLNLQLPPLGVSFFKLV